VPKVELKRIGVRRFAIVLAVIQVVVGLFCGIMMAASTFVPASFAYFFQNVAPYFLPLQSSIIPSIFFMLLGPNPMGIPSILIAPAALTLISFVLGLIQGTLIAWLYNAIAKRLGGFILTLNSPASESSLLQTKPSRQET
jgi:hypothetical protein